MIWGRVFQTGRREQGQRPWGRMSLKYSKSREKAHVTGVWLGREGVWWAEAKSGADYEEDPTNIKKRLRGYRSLHFAEWSSNFKVLPTPLISRVPYKSATIKVLNGITPTAEISKTTSNLVLTLTSGGRLLGFLLYGWQIYHLEHLIEIL